MTLLDLIDAGYNARLSDPGTSHRAARSLGSSATTLRAHILAKVVWAGAHGMTCDEVWRAIQEQHPKVRANSVSRRLTDLARMGHVVAVGERPGESGRAQQVWRSSGETF